jgi:glycosyltransferase involved in cell wall biosynthesis
MKKKKLLVIIKTLIENGISKYVERTYSKLSRTGSFDVTLLVLSKTNPIETIEKLQESNVKVITVPSINKNPLMYCMKINKIINKEFDIVHFHTDSWVNFFPIKVASKRRISKIYVQSHNSSSERVNRSVLKRQMQKIGKANYNKWVTRKMAVSEEAGEWMFGKDTDVEIIPNPVDVNKFKFSTENRNKIRKEFNISNSTILFGNIARFDTQKNPLFLISIFSKIYKENANAKLFMLGAGELKQKVIDKIKKENLEDAVIIKDWTNRVEEYYSAIDEIIFPSLYEGFPLSLIEAQAAGVPIIYSDSVTKRVEIVSNVVPFSLDKNAQEWAEKAIYNFKENKIKRDIAYGVLLEKGFDYDNHINRLVDLYNS